MITPEDIKMDGLFASVSTLLDKLSDQLPEQFVDVVVDSIDTVIEDATNLFEEVKQNNEDNDEEA